MLEAFFRFDFDDQADVVGTEPVEFLVQGEDIFRALYERQRHGVGMAHDEREILPVRLGEPRQFDVAVREVNAAVAAQPAARRLGLGDLDFQLPAVGLAHHARNLAVIERYPVAH